MVHLKIVRSGRPAGALIDILWGLALAGATLAGLTCLEALDDGGGDERHEQRLAELLPDSGSLFKADALDAEQLERIDCHLRNLDYCYAGIMASANKPLPTTDAELETRCDELRVATSCLAVYNDRCHTFKVFSLIGPLNQLERLTRLRNASAAAGFAARSAATLQSSLAQSAGIQAPPSLAQAAVNASQQLESLVARPSDGFRQQQQPLLPSADELQLLCQPGAQTEAAAKEARRKLFRLAQCLNGEAPKVSGCVEDLKTALQLFYEPTRVLPKRPTCCAMARFRLCAGKTLERTCGLGSFRQLEAAMTSALGGSADMMSRSMARVCLGAESVDSAYCKEVLPPTGTQTPQRRGRKASKLARVLDLFAFKPAPGTQPV